MLSSFLSIVDSVLTLDEGFSRKDIISGDLVVIDGNLNKDVAGRITGTAALACIWSADKNRKFYIIVGKHKIELTGSMDMNPKPLSVVNPNHTTVRVTNDQNRYFEVRFNDAVSFSAWLPRLGESLAESMCNEVLSSHHTANSIACLNMRRCIHTCELLTSPSKAYVRRVSEIYGIRRKLMEVMSTLRSNPCDVNIKDLRSLKELCWKYPEMQSDPDMKFLLERMPSDRYSSEDLQIILKDILYADPGEGSDVACAQVYHGLSSADLNVHDSSLAVVRAVLVQETDLLVSSSNDSLTEPAATGDLLSGSQSQAEGSVNPTRGASLPHNTDTTTTSIATTDTARVPVPVHRKSRIVLNGVEIQSTARSPSSAGKALSKQIKIKSKFTTPAQVRKEPVRPKTKTPPSNKKSILSEVQYNVSPLPNSAVGVLSSPAPTAAASVGTPVETPVLLSAMKASSGKVFTPAASLYDKENLPTPHKNVTPMTMPRSALKKPSSAGKSTQLKLSFAPVLDDAGSSIAPAASIDSAIEMETVETGTSLIEEDLEKEAVKPQAAGAPSPSINILAIDLVPEIVAPTESPFGTPKHHSLTKIPIFASPTGAQCTVANVASLFEDAVVYNVSAMSEPRLLMANRDIDGPIKSFPTTPEISKNESANVCINPEPQNSVVESPSEVVQEGYAESAKDSFEVVPLHDLALIAEYIVKPLTLEETSHPLEVMELPDIAITSVPPAPLVLLTVPTTTPAKAAVVALEQAVPSPTTARKCSFKKESKPTMQEIATPVRPHRSMHLSTPSTDTVAVVSAATTAPRTPAPLLPSVSSSSTLAPMPSPVCMTLRPVTPVPEKKAQEDEVKTSREDLLGRRDGSWKMSVLALCFVLVAFFAGQYNMVPRPTLSVTSVVPLVPQAAVVDLSRLSDSSVNTADAGKPPVQLSQQAEITAALTNPAVVSKERESGFEMRVRFGGASATHSDSEAVPELESFSQKPMISTPPQRSMQLHHTSPLLTQWRRLQRLLTMPVKYARVLFDTAWKKLMRVRKVLAE